MIGLHTTGTLVAKFCFISLPIIDMADNQWMMAQPYLQAPRDPMDTIEVRVEKASLHDGRLTALHLSDLTGGVISLFRPWQKASTASS